MEQILSENKQDYESRYAIKASGLDLDYVSARVAELLGIDVEQVWQQGKSRLQVQARSLLSYWAVRELGETMTAMARRLGISTAAVSKAVIRGAQIVEQNGYHLTRKLKSLGRPHSHSGS